MPVSVASIDALKAKSGTHLGFSPWMAVDQQRVNTFADATEDHQWIHVDVDRAKAGPFGGPIAHGYLTLSLIAPLWHEIVQVEGIGMAVNYGLNRVRFPAPTPVGSKIRAGATLTAVEDLPNGVQAVIAVVVENDASEKPSCIAEVLYRFYE